MAKKTVTVKRKKGSSSESSYDADSLRELPYPDSVRLRIGMYLGGADEAGAYRALKEIIDNSLDEAMAGYGKKIHVIYNTGKNLLTVIDQGRGLPMGKNKDGKFASEVALATLHGSGKFDNANYKGGVVGLNGVGASCTNAVSEFLVVWSKNSGKWMTQRFERGVKKHDPKPEAPKSKIALKNDKGTVIQFKLDKQIFGDVVVDAERIHREMGDVATLNPGVSIIVTVDDESTTYLSANGLLDMVVTKDTEKLILGKPFQFQKKGVIDIVLCWIDDSETGTFSYVNSSHTAQEGTHVQGARAAILDALKDELSEKDKIDPKFFLKGMRLALNWRMENPIYYGQTKDRLTNAEVVTAVKKMVTAPVVEFLKKNKGLVNTLIDRAKKFQKNEEKFNADNKAVKAIKLADPNARGILPGKFQPAPGYKPDEKELILVEGDSCGGSAAKSKMPWQEILPLRGKIPNPERTPFAKFIENAEVCNIFMAVGARPGDPYDVKTRRVGRVSFLPDADPDGKHIGSELIAFFVRYLPDWIKTGHTFFIDAPLYVGGHRGVKKYGNTREEVLSQFPERDRKSVLLTRMKGWGECLTKSVIIKTVDGPVRLGSIIENQPIGWSKLSKPVVVIDKDGRHRKVTKVFRKKSKVLRLRIGGRTVEATMNHPFLTCINGELQWKNAGELSVGDIVIANRSNAHFGKCAKFSTEWYEEFVSAHPTAKLSKLPKRMTVELARLLGYLVADGSGCYEISSGIYPKVVKEIKRCFEACFPDHEALVIEHDNKNMLSVRLTQNLYVKEFFHSIGYLKGWNAYTKDVPHSILSASKECVAAFIQGVFESDGYFGVLSSGNGREYDTIEHYTASERLSNSMAVLLSMFGIHAGYEEKLNVFDPFKQKASGRSAYQLKLLGSNIDKYVTEIGIVSNDKCARLLEYRKSHKTVISNTNTDVLVGVKAALRDVQKRLRTGRGSHTYNVNGNAVNLSVGFSTGAAEITYQELERNASSIDAVEVLDPKIAETMRYCLENKPVFVRVESITEGKRAVDVGDIEVPVSHSYIANGLVVHNCQSDDMHEIAMNPQTRRVRQYQLGEGDEIIVNNVMGDEVEHRKVLLGIKGGSK